jgi:hypothetical protein
VPLQPRAQVAFVFAGLCAACAPATATPTIFPPTATMPPTGLVLPPTIELAPPVSTPIELEPTQTPIPTPVIACGNDSKFDSDITVPDGAQFLPGQTFVKKWSVRNSGTCHWGPDYRLVLVSGEAMGAPNELALYPAKAGTTAILEVSLTAPDTPGVYESRWQARDPDSRLFGDFVTVKIEVIALPVTDTPTP